MNARSRLLGTVLAALLAVLVAAPPAAADLLPASWTALLPGWNDQLDPGYDTTCADGAPGCLDRTLAQQSQILTATGQSCSHNAVFPLAYVRMTETYRWTRAQAGYYQDVAYMNHMDAIFGNYYIDAYQDYVHGDRADVAQAWLYAFDAGTNKTVTGAGDLFLGMNAHINRDLPFVLYATGLVNFSATSGKADYDAVEQWLYDDTAPLLAEAAARFDPTMSSTNNALINYFSFQAVSVWRENAWRSAELLAAAPNAAARDLVAQSIENNANLMAQTLQAAFAVNPLVETNAARDAYCATHNGASAPVPYPMGTPSPYGTTVN
jgi:hypothetical protein